MCQAPEPASRSWLRTEHRGVPAVTDRTPAVLDQAAAGADGGILAHWVIVGVVAGRRAVIAEQGRDLAAAVSGVGQKPILCS